MKSRTRWIQGAKTAFAVAVAALGIGVLVWPASEHAPSLSSTAHAAQPHGYDDALAAADRRIQRAERLSKAAPQSWIRKGQLAGAHLRRAQLTGNYDSFAAADRAVEEAFALTGGRIGPWMVRVDLNYTLHRFARVPADLDALEREARRRAKGGENTEDLLGQLEAMRGGLALNQGEYSEAEALLEAALRRHRSYDTLARLADLHAQTGRVHSADELYAECLSLLGAASNENAEARAWIHLQRGLLDLGRQRLDEALTHYRDANRAFPNWWLVREHIAEIHALQGRTGDALTIYREVVAQTGDPELIDALAALVAEPERTSLLKRSRTVYEERLRLFPEATYGHALDHFLEHGDDEARAVVIAEANAKLRPNGPALLALARAYAGANRNAEARKVIEQIWRTPFRTDDLRTLGAQLDLTRPRTR